MLILEDLVDMSACSDGVLANFLYIVQRIFNLFQIVVPILAIVGLTITLTKYVLDPENKKIKNNIRNCVLAVFIFFFLPVIVNIVMGFLGDSFSVSACWNAARNNKSDNTESTYKNTENDNTLENGQGTKITG